MTRGQITPILLLLVACGRASPSPEASPGGSHLGALDAGEITSLDSGSDTSTFDSGADTLTADAGPVDPLVPCSIDRDVFYAAWGPGDLGIGAATYTNLNSQWQLSAPLSVTVGITGLSLQVSPWNGASLLPGNYEIGPTPGLDVSFVVGGVGCDPPLTSGTVSIDDLQSTTDDAGIEQISSVLLSFNMSSCVNSPVHGCIRYSASWDAGTPLPLDGGIGDGGLLSPCESGPYVFYVDPESGYGTLPDGPRMVTGAEGTWSVDVAPGFQLSVAAGADWYFSAATSDFGPLDAGTYTSSGEPSPPTIGVSVPGGGCPSLPTGTFTVAEIAPGGSKALIGFDLQCNDAGTLRGCVSYGN